MDHREQLETLLGLKGVDYRYQLSKDELFDEALAQDRGRVRADGGADDTKAFASALGKQGPLFYYTDPDCTGRRVKDTFAVAWPEVESTVWFKNDLQRYDPDKYQLLRKEVVEHLNAKKARLYVQDVFVGSDPGYSLPYRFVGEFATHAIFANNMFPKGVDGVKDPEGRLWTMLNAPTFTCDPERHGSRSEVAIIIDFRDRVCLVAGRADYNGVVKKTIFTVMNYLLPLEGVLPMHCSANVGKDGDGAILFGLSGTGKTTLSADPDRQLIGDDETAWTDDGLSNLEDGCYAKLIDLDKQAEPVIAAALSMPGTVVENVPPLPGKALAETDPQELDLTDRTLTENTRISYPLSCNPGVAEGARGPHPRTIVLLTADAFGVLPPVAVLDGDEVMYHFVSGFTSKLAGTEVGVTEPQAAFSACFGAPFMSQRPSVYAKLLRQKMDANKARCVLLNTGWTGGAYGVGSRMKIAYTRAMLNAALCGDLDEDKVEYVRHTVFGMRMPKTCPGVPDEVLDPRSTWSDGAAYDAAAEKLRGMFRANFESKGFAELGIRAVL